MRKIVLLIAIAASCIFAASAPKTHDGFFLNGIAGLGYGNYVNEIKTEGVKIESKGAKLESGFKIGGAIVPNVILHATINLSSIVTDIKASNSEGETSTLPLKNEAYKVLVFGAGITYYIPHESNIYFSATAGLADYSEFCASGRVVTEHHANFSFNLSVGKEWWVNNELGIGVALSYNHSSADTKLVGYKGEATFNSFAVVASFTFN
ncbi:hypothetical protein [Fibrobacter sp. UWB12]|uniref:hypothetical protein n=1 Tax=Fibrobacter sp. UWB12 TaxID=1896203 RepID=UPI0009151F00|nr:hypothetical protein [Fibrobacter sp. UWB12]SHK75325.1 hypothetical protein SAMN05720759_10659 [Fibrobacter sp. UWB12]